MSEPASPDSAKPRASVNWGAIAPGIAFVLIIAVGIGYYMKQEAQARRESDEVRQQVQSLGLPDGFPLQDVPIYPGLTITEKKREDAKSSDNKPMDLWEVHATTPDDKKKVFDFYKEEMLGRGMGQTQYISIPTGLQATYADEQYSVEFEIEKQPKDRATRVVIRVYRLQ